MSLAAHNQRSEPASPGQSRQASRLLPRLLEGLDRSQRVTVLDLGRALPETVHFFAQFRCKVHVVDLYSELQQGRISGHATGKTPQRQFQELLGFEPGTRLDICLLWDLPHYLDETLLRAFASALWPWLQTTSRAHAFGVHSAGTILLNREYGIVDHQTISIRRRAAPQLKNSPHPQSFMHEWLTCFTSGSGVLLPDGRVETLMNSTVGYTGQ